METKIICEKITVNYINTINSDSYITVMAQNITLSLIDQQEIKHVKLPSGLICQCHY